MVKNSKVNVGNFMYYPDFEDKDFYEKIYIKKEFNKNKIPKQQKTTEEICNSRLFQLAPQQEFLKNYISIDTPYNGILIYHGTGVGKCLAIDTPVIMYDGSIRKVQDIQIGDLLMGDDSTARTVTSLARGQDTMYKIIPKKGEAYTVNSEHILCLKSIGSKDILEISVKDYLNMSMEQKEDLKVYKVPIEFRDRPTPELHYFYGKNINNQRNLQDIYKINTRQKRLQLLAGLIDSNGEVEDNKYVFKSNIESLIDDVIFLCVSLGYAADKKRTEYEWIVEIYGEKLNTVPSKKYKEVMANKIQKNVLESEFTVENMGIGDYYGFTLDGNCRFLFGDTTVTHNTCSAVQIAEGFKDIMRRMHSDSKRKITVLLSSRIVPSFRNQIYDIKKETKKEKPDDIVQCTGNTYSLDFEQFSGLTTLQKEKETGRAVNSVYQFYGYEKFVNEIMNDIGWDGKLHTLTDAQKKAIRTKFTNRILIIDEIQNIKSDSGRTGEAKVMKKVPPILQAVIRYGENIRLVLMSATPMYDNAGEIVYILNLLLENDGREPIKKSDIFDAEDNLIPGAEERLKELSKGYVSYLRGDNPVVFPLKLYPQRAKTPKILYDIYGELIPENERLKSLELFMCPMSKYQWGVYKSVMNEDMNVNSNNVINNDNNANNNNNKKNNNNENDEIFSKSVLRPLCNIVLPNKAGNNCLPKLDDAYQKVDNGEGAFVVDLGQAKSNERKVRRKTFQFRYQSHLRMDIGTKMETGFLDEKYLKKYSTKFFEALQNIKFGKGICYVYSEFVWGGVLPFAMMLEQNGFERYPWSGERPLLDYPKKRNPICAVCGKDSLAKVHEDKKNKDYHEFRRVRYILMTGNANISVLDPRSLLNIINNENNKNGEEVKVIIGTRTTAEGMDFKRIRQVHILEPWFNLSRMDQITGRGSRFCSHADLPKLEQNVEVFYYAVEPPNEESKRIKEIETVDTRIYRLAEIKDRKIKKVEYILKQAAVDCALNKNGNVFDFEGKTVEMVSSSGRKVKLSLGDINGSRECDYRNCDYNCVWQPDKKKEYKINIDTYNERFARSDITKCKNIMKRLYKTGYVYKLEDLVKIISAHMKNLELRFIYLAIKEMINNVNEPVYDMYDRRGYLIYRGSYYIFQPLEFNYLEAPMRYRMVTFKEKPLQYAFDEELLEEGEFNVVAKNRNGDTLETIIKRAEKLFEAIQDTYKDKMYVILSMLVDKLNDKEKSNLIKKIILDYYETKGKMSNVYLVQLMRYFEPLLLYKYRDLEVGKSDKENDKLIGYYVVFPDLKNNGTKNNVKIYCYNNETKLISECSSEIRDKIKLNMKIKLTKEARNTVRNFNIIYGFMELKGGPYVFKIFDGTRDTGAVTLEMKKSKRSEVKGKECTHHSLPELESVSKKLEVAVKNKDEKAKMAYCVIMEYELRKYDLERKDGKRWFMNAIESMRRKMGVGK